MEDRHSRLERPATKICDLLFWPPPDRARLTDRLDKAARQLRVELAARREADAELEALQSSTALVWGLVLGSADGTSSLAASMSMAAELLKSWIDVAAANGVRWGPVLCWLLLCHISRS
jgi:hypothetical protein